MPGMPVPDLSHVDWAKVLSLSFTVLPAVYKYRAVLAKIVDVLAEAIGFTALIGGLYIYSRTLPEVNLATAQFRIDPTVSALEYLRTLDLLYFGAISLMVLGGLLTVSGLIGRLQASVLDRVKSGPQMKTSPPKRR